MKKNNDIDKLRSGIDGVDKQLMTLLSKRARLAHKIGRLKKSLGTAIYVPSREKQIFDRLAKLNLGPYNNTAIHAIFREIISATRALEEPIRVAFLGPEATFTHMAAVEHFGQSAAFAAKQDIATVFRDVETGSADFGVVPIENSTEGVVNYTLDTIVGSDLKICSEVIIAVGQQLMSAEKDLSQIRTVYSHPQALAQCRTWLLKNLPKAELVSTDSTAAAAERATRESGVAALASSLAANTYGLNILAKNVQDLVNNQTRFLILGEHEASKTGKDKTSIAFVTKDQPGILYHLLRHIAVAKINLTKIESRPLKTRAWEYMFFIDLDGHVNDTRVKKALEKMKKECVTFRILGSYPRAV